ncbi:MAG: hypothetical protein ACQETH_14480 [Candidatus Rifleibacteriota bacterium]
MIRISLIRRGIDASHQTMKRAGPVLATILAVQLFIVGFRYHDMKRQQSTYTEAQQTLSALQREAESFAVDEDLQQLAGKVATRNNWLIDLRNSPLSRLAKLQKDCPNNIRFLSFNADLTSGKIILTAPDLNSVSSWLNSHFSNRGNISVTGRENNLLLIQYVWSG